MAAIPTTGIPSSERPHYACPRCNSTMVRTWRRPMDRFISHFVPVHRFRCEHYACRWEGNVRVDRELLRNHRSGFAPLEEMRAPSDPMPGWASFGLALVVVAALVALAAMFFDFRGR